MMFSAVQVVAEKVELPELNEEMRSMMKRGLRSMGHEEKKVDAIVDESIDGFNDIVGDVNKLMEHPEAGEYDDIIGLIAEQALDLFADVDGEGEVMNRRSLYNADKYKGCLRTDETPFALKCYHKWNKGSSCGGEDENKFYYTIVEVDDINIFCGIAKIIDKFGEFFTEVLPGLVNMVPKVFGMFGKFIELSLNSGVDYIAQLPQKMFDMLFLPMQLQKLIECILETLEEFVDILFVGYTDEITGTDYPAILSHQGSSTFDVDKLFTSGGSASDIVDFFKSLCETFKPKGGFGLLQIDTTDGERTADDAWDSTMLPEEEFARDIFQGPGEADLWEVFSEIPERVHQPWNSDDPKLYEGFRQTLFDYGRLGLSFKVEEGTEYEIKLPWQNSGCEIIPNPFDFSDTDCVMQIKKDLARAKKLEQLVSEVFCGSLEEGTVFTAMMTVPCKAATGVLKVLNSAGDGFVSSIESHDDLITANYLQTAQKRQLFGLETALHGRFQRDEIISKTMCNETTSAGPKKYAGCNGYDDNCNWEFDDCAEDLFPPEVHTGMAQAQCGDKWFASPAEARQCLEQFISVEDDCQPVESGVSVPVKANPSSPACDDYTATVTATTTGTCAGVATQVEITGIKIDNGEPQIGALSCPSVLPRDGVMHDLGLIGGEVSDECGSEPSVSVEVYSNEWSHNSLDAEVYSDPDTGKFGVVLRGTSLSVDHCNPQVNDCETARFEGRAYQIKITAVDEAGNEATQSCTVMVPPQHASDSWDASATAASWKTPRRLDGPEIPTEPCPVPCAYFADGATKYDSAYCQKYNPKDDDHESICYPVSGPMDKRPCYKLDHHNRCLNTVAPTAMPSHTPTSEPTLFPTNIPTYSPTASPEQVDNLVEFKLLATLNDHQTQEACVPDQFIMRRGQGCDGRDNNCDTERRVDECNEDQFAPVLDLTAARVECSSKVFDNNSQAEACIRKFAVVEDDCSSANSMQLKVHIEGACGETTAVVSTEDQCGNSVTASLPLFVDGAKPTVTCSLRVPNVASNETNVYLAHNDDPFHWGDPYYGECETNGKWYDVQLDYTAEDSCGEALQVKLEVFADENLWGMTDTKTYAQADASGLKKYGLVLHEDAGKPCKHNECFDCNPNGRVYTVAVTATDSAGRVSEPALCTITVSEKDDLLHRWDHNIPENNVDGEDGFHDHRAYPSGKQYLLLSETEIWGDSAQLRRAGAGLSNTGVTPPPATDPSDDVTKYIVNYLKAQQQLQDEYTSSNNTGSIVLYSLLSVGTVCGILITGVYIHKKHSSMHLETDLETYRNH